MNTQKLIYGIGINDASCVDTVIRHGSNRSRPIYSAWLNMLGRCYSPSIQIKRPTYIDCYVVDEWHRFSAFSEWMSGENWKGMSLDKDILNPGNKIYGPDQCVFITKSLNGFLTDRSRDRGEFPLGVSWNNRMGKFQAFCSNPWTRKNENLGYFESKDEAHKAWKLRKHQHACAYSRIQDDPRVAAALRIRFLSEA